MSIVRYADVKVHGGKEWLTAVRSYDPIDMIFDVGKEWVTFWKNIL